MSVSELLHNAADHLQEFGWRNDGGGWFIEYGQPACLEGAIGVVAERDAENWLAQTTLVREAKAAVRRHLTETRPRHINPVAGYVIAWAWNDRIAKDEAEVIEVLRAAALVEETKEAAAIIAAASTVDVREVVRHG